MDPKVLGGLQDSHPGRRNHLKPVYQLEGNLPSRKTFHRVLTIARQSPCRRDWSPDSTGGRGMGGTHSDLDALTYAAKLTPKPHTRAPMMDSRVPGPLYFSFQCSHAE